MPPVTIGTAAAQPGEIVTGWLDAVSLPTGGADRFPVIIAQGRRGAGGPVFWVTASIHGGEHTGLITALQLVTPDLVEALRGTLIVIPTLNPAGLRTKERQSYYYSGDPNRIFPDPHAEPANTGDQPPPAGLEEAYRRVYSAIESTQPVGLLDLHTAQIGSLPMVFRDPIFFHRTRRRGMTRSEAAALQARVGEMLDALGFTIVNEFVAGSYIDKGLHRSVSGSALNGLGIPAATIELGSWMHIDRGVVDACLAGIRNVLRWAGLLDGDPEPISAIPVIRPGYPVRRHLHPHAPAAGIAHRLVEVGDPVRKGQPLVRMTDIFGRPLNGDGLLTSDYDGFVLAWQSGVVRFRGEPILMLAVRDDSDLVIPYPT